MTTAPDEPTASDAEATWTATDWLGKGIANASGRRLARREYPQTTK